MTSTNVERRTHAPARSLKPPRLPNGHTYEDATVDEWQSWWREGFASRWSPSAVHAARELLQLIDAYAKAEDVGTQIRLASAIRAGRRALGLFEPSPLEQEQPAAPKVYRDTRPDPRLVVAS